MKLQLWMGMCALVFAAGNTHASLNTEERSINGTADTLKQGRVEAGVGSLAFGVTDDLMLQIPTFGLIGGQYSLEAKYRINLSDSVKLSPYALGGYASSVSMDGVMAGGGAYLGFDFGEDKRSSFTLQLGAKYSPAYSYSLFSDTEAATTVKVGSTFAPTYGLEYDRYTDGGNLFYVGMQGLIPYLGYTWAWENVHFGLLSSLGSLFIPLPYVYFRF